MKCAVSQIIHGDHSPNCPIVIMAMDTQKLHHLTVRTRLFDKLRQLTLETIIAVGDFSVEHNHVELFTMSDAKWQIKEDYAYANDIGYYSILAVEKKFIIFGGFSRKRTVLPKFDIKSKRYI